MGFIARPTAPLNPSSDCLLTFLCIACNMSPKLLPYRGTGQGLACLEDIGARSLILASMPGGLASVPL
jgi:hypothetical protein